MQIDGSTALVTGANRGLGAAFVQELLDRGAAKVYAAARNPEPSADPRVVPLRLDVTDPDQVVALWLRTTCCGGELLGAATEEHLAYLEDYLAASLRERPEAVISPMGRRWVGKGLSWQLPDWMKAAKHRDEVLAALARLRATLPSDSSAS